LILDPFHDLGAASRPVLVNVVRSSSGPGQFMLWEIAR
jgi:hypothetical protein